MILSTTTAGIIDVSTIPHFRVNLSSNEAAIAAVTGALQDRLSEQSKLKSVRAEITFGCLTSLDADALLSYSLFSDPLSCPMKHNIPYGT